ncbi:MAG: 50S ribosomal protein L24 [Chthoniobacterales bacterium]
MSRLKFHVKKGDEVEVISGNHRGASGKVLQVLPKKRQVLIEGVRMIKKTVRKSQDHPNGAIITREGPIHISNVKLAEARRPGKQGREE